MRDYDEDTLRNIVVAASAGTYSANQLQQLGLDITINAFGNKNRFIGNVNDPIYPDVIVWKKHSPNQDAIAVERIETLDSIPYSEDLWVKLASFGSMFNLVVPAEQKENVEVILRRLDIRDKITLQTYKYNIENERFDFVTIGRTG